jgi:hypothetical protein
MNHGTIFPVVLSVAAVFATFFSLGFCCLVLLRRRNLGHLDISTASVAYQLESYGHILRWDKHAFYLHGKPFVLVSGEFHYWRVPDRSRWRSVLLMYKACGLNCIRIYFNWSVE